MERRGTRPELRAVVAFDRTAVPDGAAQNGAVSPRYDRCLAQRAFRHDLAAAQRERVAYSGPVALLISARTSGPAEDFLVSFQAGGRGPTFGETSAGNTGKTATLALASGWKLRVTVARDAFPPPDGKEFA